MEVDVRDDAVEQRVRVHPVRGRQRVGGRRALAGGAGAAVHGAGHGARARRQVHGAARTGRQVLERPTRCLS